MISVLYIINESEAGGAAQSLLDMLPADRGRIRAVAVIPSEGSIEARFRQKNIDCYVVPFQTDHRKIGVHTAAEVDRVFMSNYLAAQKLQEIIRREKIELIHTNSSVSNVGAMAALMAGIPHVWHIREALEEQFGFEFLDTTLKMKLFACSDRIITISNYVKNACKDQYGLDSVCIYNGVDAARFLSENFDKKDESSFLFAGVISPAKGQEDAVRAAHELIRDGEEIQLYIVGSGSYQYRWLLKKYVLKYGLEQNIHFLDYREDLRQLRDKCLYSITASKMEALGRVTIEAMMAGCVVIGADTGGTAEIIGQDHSRGYLYRQGDDKSLAEMMRYAMAHRENNEKIQRTAQQYSLDRFDITKYRENIIKIYEELLQGKETKGREQKADLLSRLDIRYRALLDKAVCGYHQTGYEKQQILLKTVQRWLCNQLEHKSLEAVLLKQGIHSIAIYGMGYLGCCLYDELEEGRIAVEYVMDRRMAYRDGILKIVDPEEVEEPLPQVDAVIVTVLGGAEQLQENIWKKCADKVVMLQELLEWCETMEG